MYDLKELGQANKFCHRTWEPSVLDGGFCVGTAVVVRLLIGSFGASGKDERRWGLHVDWVLRGKPAFRGLIPQWATDGTDGLEPSFLERVVRHVWIG